ncbi:hypothetical protein RI496_00530 [Aeromonas dhakensis]|uniref:hypothetical protein n=1 Tax=Aeromonas dhakensis TaxID=196024 RepID=UPI0034491D25
MSLFLNHCCHRQARSGLDCPPTINSVSDFHAHVHFWRLWSQLIMVFPADPTGSAFYWLQEGKQAA